MRLVYNTLLHLLRTALCENKPTYARKQKIYIGSQSPKYQEKLRNARLCNNDKNYIYLPRQNSTGLQNAVKNVGIC